MRSRWIVALALVAGALPGCATTADEPEVATAPTPSLDTSEQESAERNDGGSEATRPAGGDKKERGGRGGGDPSPGSSPGGRSDDDGEDPADPGGGAGGSGPGPRDEKAGGAPPRGGSGGGALAPAAGDYVYTQRGFEEFCAGGGCDRRVLPKRQIVDTSVRRSGSTATVVAEMTASRSRMSRTTTRFTRAGAFVTEVYVRFTYAGYTFERTYRPDPAVETLRFPLARGTSWSGSWKGNVSGTYSVTVEGRERVRAGRSRVEAVRIETFTRFRGDFEGRASATLWVDPRSKALVKTAGNLNVKSAFGRYVTGFATALSSGPGY